jgi:hypothetical protein
MQKGRLSGAGSRMEGQANAGPDDMSGPAFRIKRPRLGAA